MFFRIYHQQLFYLYTFCCFHFSIDIELRLAHCSCVLQHLTARRASAECKFVRVSKNIDSFHCESNAKREQQKQHAKNRILKNTRNILNQTRTEAAHTNTQKHTHTCITNCCVNFISLSVKFKLTCGFYVCVSVCKRIRNMYVIV